MSPVCIELSFCHWILLTKDVVSVKESHAKYLVRKVYCTKCQLLRLVNAPITIFLFKSNIISTMNTTQKAY